MRERARVVADERQEHENARVGAIVVLELRVRELDRLDVVLSVQPMTALLNPGMSWLLPASNSSGSRPSDESKISPSSKRPS